MTLKTTINTDFIRKHPAQLVLTVLGLSGVVLIFLPFVDDHVPATVFSISYPRRCRRLTFLMGYSGLSPPPCCCRLRSLLVTCAGY